MESLTFPLSVQTTFLTEHPGITSLMGTTTTDTKITNATIAALKGTFSTNVLPEQALPVTPQEEEDPRSSDFRKF